MVVFRLTLPEFFLLNRNIAQPNPIKNNDVGITKKAEKCPELFVFDITSPKANPSKIKKLATEINKIKNMTFSDFDNFN